LSWEQKSEKLWKVRQQRGRKFVVVERGNEESRWGIRGMGKEREETCQELSKV